MIITNRIAVEPTNCDDPAKSLKEIYYERYCLRLHLQWFSYSCSEVGREKKKNAIKPFRLIIVVIDFFFLFFS